MHGNDKVIKILVEEFDANINARDYSGRKPRQVAKNTLTIESQKFLENIHQETAPEPSQAGAIRKKSQTSKQYSSINSIITPSAALVGFYGGDRPPTQQLEPPPDKQRDRASSFGKFLHKKDKKKHKKEQRAATADIPPEYATPSAGFLIGSPQQLQKVEDEKRENEREVMMHRTHSDPSFRLTSEI